MENQQFLIKFPAFPPSGASLVNTIYPALAAQQLELEQERERVQELQLRAEERDRFALHQSIADSFRPRAQSSIVIGSRI